MEKEGKLVISLVYEKLHKAVLVLFSSMQGYGTIYIDKVPICLIDSKWSRSKPRPCTQILVRFFLVKKA